MGIHGAYRGKLIDVDLSARKISEVKLPAESVLRRWLGGTGLGMYLFAREFKRGMKTTDPEAPCYIMTGPLTGTTSPQSSNWTIINLRFLPDYCIGLSQAHGYFGARLKHAGWDGIVLRGAASSPVYLWIDDGQVEIRDAGAFWGMDTYETPREMKRALGDDKFSVACIGPGGENFVLGATVRADGVYTCAMGDAGMAWGSKKLKAIAVRGTGQVPIAHPAAFEEVCARWRTLLDQQPFPPPARNAFFRYIGKFADHGGIPVKNFTEPESGQIWGQSLLNDYPKWKVTPVGSWQCDMACHHETTVTTGPLAGSMAAGFGSEVFEEIGPNLGIMDSGTSMALAGLVDGLGIHSGEIPRTIAMIMEAYNNGRLSEEQVDGLDLNWGNYQAVIEILEKTVRREGIGALVAKGMREAGKSLGIEDLAVHMRGVGFQGHDFRYHPMALFVRQVVSGAGAAPQDAGGLYSAVAPLGGGEPDLGYDAPLSATKPEGIGKASLDGQCLKLWMDSTGSCKFAVERVKGGQDVAIGAIDHAVGWQPWSREEAMLLGRRITVLQRFISLARGFDPRSDFDIGERMLDVKSGPAKGRAAPLGPNLARWRLEYYEAQDWDSGTGIPRAGALEKVGLAGVRLGQVLPGSKAPRKGLA